MSMWEFIHLHPVYTFWLGVFVLVFASMGLGFLFKCWNRMWRHLNVRKAGWPPLHLDADGDFKRELDDEH